MRYLDANIFIYILDEVSEKYFRETSEKILKRMQNGESIITSSITLMEVFWWCERYLKHRIKEVYEMILSYEGLNVINVTFDMLDVALSYKEKYGLEINDCVSLVLMARLGVSEIYSNDEDFDKVEGIKRIFN